MDLQSLALFGEDGNSTGTLTATQLNAGAASSSTDIGALLANGIRGAVQGAMAAEVAGAYADGQLVNTASGVPASASQNNLLPLILIGAVLWMVMK